MKASNVKQSHRHEKFVECLKKEPKNLKATKSVGIDETSYTSGKIVLRVLTGSNQSYLNGTGMDIEELVKAELKARGIKKEVAKDASIIKRKAIRLHEYLRILKTNTIREWKETDVQAFIPQSREMIILFKSSGHHDRILGIINKTEQLDADEFHT